MFLSGVLRGGVVYSDHTTDAAGKTDTKHEPCEV